MRKQSRYPSKKGKGKCRGCGADVPPKRQTWCSTDCYNRLCPQMVIEAVRARDEDICQSCGIQTVRRKPCYGYRETWPEHDAKVEKWRNELRPEYDHIKPFSEGGETVVENMRTLCRKCHVARTAAWHKERKAKGNPQELVLGL